MVNIKNIFVLFGVTCMVSIVYGRTVSVDIPKNLVENKADSQNMIIVSRPPSEPSENFGNIYGDTDIAITSFKAKKSRLKEAYVWMHEASSGIIAVQIARESPYGQVIATGTLTGKTTGKHQIAFFGNIYLEKDSTYYLKLFKGEPATIKGAMAKAAENSNDIQAYNTYGPLAYDLAHELVFDQWEGIQPSNVSFGQKKQFPTGYEKKVNEALRSNIDLFGEQILNLPEGPTYDNVKDFLTPLKLIGTGVTESGVYYLPFGRPLNLSGYGPVALHVGDGSQIVSQHSTGTKATFYVGAEGQERYGLAEARLEEERLEDGYQPVLINNYTDNSGISYKQESFSDYTRLTTELVSFVKLTVRKSQQNTNNATVRIVFSDNDLTLDGHVLKSGNKVRALLTEGGQLTGGNTVTYQLDLSTNDQEIYVARLLNPGDCITVVPDSIFYQREKTELKDFWNDQLMKSAVYEVPEERVNHAMKGLLIQNLFMGYLYSIGNIYQTWFQPEGNDAATILGQYGYIENQKAIIEVLLSVPFREYPTWEMGELLSHSAQYYHISKDTAFIENHKAKFSQFMENLKNQIDQSPHGVLNAEAFSGDIAEPLVYLHHQAVAWRGLRDMASIYVELSDPMGNKYLTLADGLRRRLLHGLDENKTVLPDSSVFLPTEIFTKEKPKPYKLITETKYGSYWNLCFPYVPVSGLLDATTIDNYYQYLNNHGAFLLGMVRFNYYPVEVGSHRRDGLPGYKATGVDNVYGLNIARLFMMVDDPDRFVLSFYAKLAHGMTRNTLISGEGDTVGPFPGEYYRTSYLSPSSFNNSWFLLMLRLMLVAEIEGEEGKIDKLHLAHSTPRAWLEHGKQIKVERAPTIYGHIGYEINSEIDSGRINVTVTMPEHIHDAKGVIIRLRTPGKIQIKSVKINGKKFKAFDQEKEIIDLTGLQGMLNISVDYR